MFSSCLKNTGNFEKTCCRTHAEGARECIPNTIMETTRVVERRVHFVVYTFVVYTFVANTFVAYTFVARAREPHTRAEGAGRGSRIHKNLRLFVSLVCKARELQFF